MTNYWDEGHTLSYGDWHKDSRGITYRITFRHRDEEAINIQVKNAIAIGWGEKMAKEVVERNIYWDNLLRDNLVREDMAFKANSILDIDNFFDLEKRQRQIDRLAEEIRIARTTLAGRHITGTESFANVERKVEKDEDDETTR